MTEPHGALTEAITGVALAALAFAEGEAWWSAALVDWVATHEPLAELDGLEVRADLDLASVRVGAVGPSSAAVTRAHRWARHLGLVDDDPAPADDARWAVPPDAASSMSWIGLDADGLRSGVEHRLVPGTALSAIVGELTDSPAVDALLDWAGADSVTVDALGRPAGTPDVDLLVELPGGDIDAQLASGLGLFDRFGVEPPTDDALGAVLLTGRPRLVARLRLLATGAAEISVGTRHPSTETLLRAADAVGERADESFVAFEGALGVTDRELLELVRGPGDAARVSYRLPAR